MNLTPNEILIICLVALIALGPKQLPDAARKIAKGFSELRRHSSQLQAGITSVVDRAVEESHDQELSRQGEQDDASAPKEPEDRGPE